MTWLSPLSLFAGPYAMLARTGIVVLAAGALGAFCWVKGNQHGTEKLTDYKAAQALEATKINAARERVTKQVITKYVTQTVPKTEIVTQTVEKEVLRYVAANPTSNCLDTQWRILHDAAAANAIPDAP